MGGFWMVRTIRSGSVIEKTQFYVGERKVRADRKKGSSSRAKMEANRTAAVRLLARTINCNWTKGDLFLSLDYDAAHLPKDAADSDKQASLFWRRLSRELKAQGVKVRGLWLAADKDDAGDPARLHVHAILSAEGTSIAWDPETGKMLCCMIGTRELSELWGNGGAYVEPLHDQEDYTPLAVYLLRQAAETPDGKRWHPSRGLQKPVIESERVTAYPRPLRSPGGAKVHEIGRYDEETGTHYIRYTRKKKQEKPDDGAPVSAPGGTRSEVKNC